MLITLKKWTCLGVLDRGERGDDNETSLREGSLIEMSTTVLPYSRCSLSSLIVFYLRMWHFLYFSFSLCLLNLIDSQSCLVATSIRWVLILQWSTTPRTVAILTDLPYLHSILSQLLYLYFYRSLCFPTIGLLKKKKKTRKKKKEIFFLKIKINFNTFHFRKYNYNRKE